MTVRPLSLCLLLLALCATGCPTGADPTGAARPAALPPVPSGDYFPLAEGMQWKYEVVTTGASVQGLMVLHVATLAKEGNDTTAEGLRTLQLRFSDGTTHASQAKVSWRKGRSAVYETIEGEGEGGERRVLALPLKVGADWTFGDQTMVVTGVEDLTINGREYPKAVKVRAEDGDRVGYATFAKDVGMVSWWGRKLPPTGDRQIGFGLLEHIKKGASPPSPPAPSPSSSPATVS